MALRKKGNYYYGKTQSDIKEELLRYSEKTGYPATHYADAVCVCGGKTFRLAVDEDEGSAARTCMACGAEHLIGDSADYIADAELEERVCLCGKGAFEITAGVALYQASEDVKWFYIGCRCENCGLTGCYGDWKNEFDDFRRLLSQV